MHRALLRSPATSSPGGLGKHSIPLNLTRMG